MPDEISDEESLRRLREFLRDVQHLLGRIVDRPQRVIPRRHRDRMSTAWDSVQPKFESVVRVLEKYGYSACAVTSGEEALACFNRQHFDAVLMDIQMPDIDGFEVTRRIRNVEGTGRRVPVIATTAHALDGDRERCLAAGMDEYLTKPIQFDELFAALERVANQSTAMAR